MSNIILSFDRIAFTLFGKIPVAWYGLIVTAAIVFAYILFLFLAKKRGIDMDFCLELFIWIVPISVLFARLGYVLPKKEYFPIESWGDFVALFDITEGGITIIAAIAGGIVAIFLCCLRTKKYHMAHVCDCVVIALILGQIIGRWGNFCNQELFGEIITNPSMQWFPFAVFIDATGEYHYALFFYESILNIIGLAIFLVMFFKLKGKLKPMGLTLLYIFWYGLIRSSLEYLKYDHQNFGNSNIGIAQTMCYIAMAVSAVLFVLLQTGKIHFTTKWFEGLIEKKKQQVLDKQLAIETALKEQNSTGSLSETNLNSIVLNNETNNNSSKSNDNIAIDDVAVKNVIDINDEVTKNENVELNETLNQNQKVEKKSFGQTTKEMMSNIGKKTKIFFVNVGNKSKELCKKTGEKIKSLSKKNDNEKNKSSAEDLQEDNADNKEDV